MGAPTVRGHIKQYFEKHPKEKVWLSDLVDFCADMNNRRPTNEGVKNAVIALLGEGLQLEIIEYGQCWKYTPTDEKVNKMFELVHTTKSGVMILEDTDGQTHIVKPVDI